MGTKILLVIVGICGAIAAVRFFLLFGGKKLILKIQLKFTTEKELLKRVAFLYENFETLSEVKINNRLYGIMEVLNLLYKKNSVHEIGTNFRKLKDGCNSKWYEAKKYLTPFFYHRTGDEINFQRAKNETKPIVDHLYEILMN